MIGYKEISSPGRLCLFGEHSDWASQYGMHPGYCIVVGTDQSIQAEVSSDRDFCVETLVPDEMGRPSGRVRQMRCPWEDSILLEAAKDENEFFRYCAGVAYELKRRKKLAHGLNMRITSMELPLKKGVSSSAAVGILVARAFNAVYNLNLFPHELMEMSYVGERLTGSQCGRMDQACVYGSVPVLLVFEKSKQERIEPIFPKEDLYLFYVDLAGHKNTVEILQDLNDAYLKDDQLKTALGQQNEEIVRRAFQMIQSGQAKALGDLMIEAQQLFDTQIACHSLTQLAAPLLHEVLGLESIKSHVYGGKGVGSQGDGTAQFIARSEVDRNKAMHAVCTAFPQMRCFPLTIRGQGDGVNSKKVRREESKRVRGDEGKVVEVRGRSDGRRTVRS